MTDEEYRQQVHQRWKESMALLGLDDSGPEPEPAKPSPAPLPPVPAEPRHPRVAVAEAPVMEEPPRRQSWPPPEPEPVGVPEIEMQTVPAPDDADDAEPLTQEPELAAAPAPEIADEQPDRRRRGRRGRRGQRTEAGDGDTPAGDAEDQPKDKERGKRGRGRRRTSKPVEAATADTDETATPEAATDGDFGDDEPNDLSEWDVPSWQDLIASLYRPER